MSDQMALRLTDVFTNPKTGAKVYARVDVNGEYNTADLLAQMTPEMQERFKAAYQELFGDDEDGE